MACKKEITHKTFFVHNHVMCICDEPKLKKNISTEICKGCQKGSNFKRLVKTLYCPMSIFTNMQDRCLNIRKEKV